jgi:hypothetical protein
MKWVPANGALQGMARSAKAKTPRVSSRGFIRRLETNLRFRLAFSVPASSNCYRLLPVT